MPQLRSTVDDLRLVREHSRKPEETEKTTTDGDMPLHHDGMATCNDDDDDDAAQHRQGSLADGGRGRGCQRRKESMSRPHDDGGDESRQLADARGPEQGAPGAEAASEAPAGARGAQQAVTTNPNDAPPPPKEQRHPGIAGTGGRLDDSHAASATAPSAAAAAPSPDDGLGPDTYEAQHVHDVYESIAPHFSATRYKPWPVIARFLLALAPGSLGLDVGCGNGKYLAVNPNVCVLGSDRSAALVRIARDHGGPRRSDVAVADGLALPYRHGCADFAICVAVIHHLSTRDRRRDAVRALLDCVKAPDGKILVYVWALEQRGSRRGWDEGAAQDQLVPWVMKRKGSSDTTYQRYYHLFKEGELEEDVAAVGGRVLENGYDKDNWWVIASRHT